MKKIYNYAFKLVCIYILVLSLFAVSNIEIRVSNHSNSIQDLNQERIIVSSLLASTSNEFLLKDEIKEESIELESEIVTFDTENSDKFVSEEKDEENVAEKSISPPVETVNLIDTSSFAVLKEETINLSHYGHDCYGCVSGKTASGYYVGDGRIYYQDNTFGSVRVVAADTKYPLGTILRLGYHGSKITAIVLDRGGAISDNNRFQIDLLTHSNSEAYELGIVENTTLEVLRLGY